MQRDVRLVASHWIAEENPVEFSAEWASGWAYPRNRSPPNGGEADRGVAIAAARAARPTRHRPPQDAAGEDRVALELILASDKTVSHRQMQSISARPSVDGRIVRQNRHVHVAAALHQRPLGQILLRAVPLVADVVDARKVAAAAGCWRRRSVAARKQHRSSKGGDESRAHHTIFFSISASRASRAIEPLAPQPTISESR